MLFVDKGDEVFSAGWIELPHCIPPQESSIRCRCIRFPGSPLQITQYFHPVAISASGLVQYLHFSYTSGVLGNNGESSSSSSPQQHAHPRGRSGRCAPVPAPASPSRAAVGGFCGHWHPQLPMASGKLAIGQLGS